MEFVMPVLEGAWRYVLTLRISDYLDIALMAYAIYWLLKLVGTSKVESVGKVILLFLLALMLSDAFSLNGIYFLLSHILSLGALALIVLFQPEIRHLIDQLGSSRWRSFNPFARTQQVSAIENAIAQTVLACTEMSNSRTGVLIVFEREMALDDVARTGTIVDARVSSELLKNIFFVKAAMHDGAVIMRDGRLLAGGCMLPLSKNINLSRALGMRQRAGSGSSENMPSTELTDDDFTDGKIDTLTLLVKCGLAASKGEGRRLVQQGGISVNDEKVTDFATAFEKAVFAGDGAIIRKGKKVFHKALVK